jgi:hypothetical protein
MIEIEQLQVQVKSGKALPGRLGKIAKRMTKLGNEAKSFLRLGSA